jgi:hypothetical protein
MNDEQRARDLAEKVLEDMSAEDRRTVLEAAKYALTEHVRADYADEHLNPLAEQIAVEVIASKYLDLLASKLEQNLTTEDALELLGDDSPGGHTN